MNRRLSGIVAASLVLAGVGAYLGFTGWRWYQSPLPIRHTITIEVKPGEPVTTLSHRLAARGVLVRSWDLSVLARLEGATGQIQAGQYAIRPGTTAVALLHMLVSGKVVMHTFTIVPGWTYQQLISHLNGDANLKHELKGLSPKQVMRRLGHPGEKPEGRFYPNTYKFARGTADVTIMKKAYHAMQRHLRAQWRHRAQGLWYQSRYQALILASIVEKETAVPSERPKIAGVFLRRLKKGMYLDADPTVIYGLKQDHLYQGLLTAKDMAKPTAYNTYLQHGLPPTPICMPSLASVQAAMHPAQGKALYFVAKGNGTHVFSDTLAHQDKMIRKYLLKSNGSKKGKKHHGGG